MERVFKRVLEGTQIFDQIYDKLQNSANQSQKEKLEADLKKELKKLQKLRDQIKTWIGSNDVRDKKQLIEQRRLIENEMERFKVVEREIKQKTWQSSPEDDPHFEEKKNTCDFLQEQIEALEEQTETLEQEEETLQTGRKGKKDHAKQDRIAEIEHHVERNKWHIHHMEIMIRMVENDTLAFESVDELRDDILYYVESNQEVDFAEDEAIYDDLGLVEDDEDEVETIVRDDTYTLEDLAQDLSKEREEKSKEDKKKKSPSNSSTPAPASIPSTPVSAPRVVPAVAPLPPPSFASLVSNPAASTGSAVTSTPASSLSPPALPSAPVAAVSAPLVATAAPQTAAPQTAAPQTVAPQTAAPQTVAPSTTAPQTVAPSTTAPQTAASSTAAPPTAAPTVYTPAPIAVPPVSSTSAPVSSSSHSKTLDIPCIADLTPVFDTLSARLADPAAQLLGPQLEVSYLHCPDAVIADRPRYYYAESPYPTPDYYPNELLASLDDPRIFATMDLDTLFYVFYYRQGSYQQYLAARELKSRSWRFHKRFLTWFQRHEDPKIINPEFEQGTYRFFDFEGSWLQRRKSNFKFEYQYLEDEI